MSEFGTIVSQISGPCLVILQAGQINTGAFDDFESLIPLAKKVGAWVHIDGAFGLWAVSHQESGSLRPEWNWPTAGQPMGTNGCRHRMTAALQ